MAELALATVDDLRNALQDLTFDAGFAQSAIDRATALVRSVARQRFTYVQGDVVELQGGDRELVLPERPVIVDAQNPLTVAELAVNGSAWTSVEGQFWYRQGDRLIRQWPTQWLPQMQVPWVRETTRLWAPPRPPGVWAPRVRVTYSHGYLVAPMELTSIVIGAAVKLATNPQGLRTEQVGGVSLTWASESLRNPRDMVDTIREELKAIGIRRGGAFSVASV